MELLPPGLSGHSLECTVLKEDFGTSAGGIPRTLAAINARIRRQLAPWSAGLVGTNVKGIGLTRRCSEP